MGIYFYFSQLGDQTPTLEIIQILVSFHCFSSNYELLKHVETLKYIEDIKL